MKDMRSIENQHTTSLEEAGFRVYRGWSGELAERLVEGSREEEMRRRVPRDVGERFASVDSAYEWYRANEHVVYALADRAALAGVIWFSRRVRPEFEADYTFAIRMYEKARGRGMAGRFMAAAHRDFEAFQRYEGNLWLVTDTDNRTARALYEHQGYLPQGEEDGRVVMVRRGATPVKQKEA